MVLSQISLRLDLSPVWDPLSISPNMWFLGRLANHRGLPAPLVFTFEPPISLCLSLGPLTCWLAQGVNAFVCPNFHWPSCLNHQCTSMLSPYLDITLESYPFPSWARFRRNHYLSSSPCLCPWLLFMLCWRKSLI